MRQEIFEGGDGNDNCLLSIEKLPVKNKKRAMESI
jgi:hypothetical protein